MKGWQIFFKIFASGPQKSMLVLGKSYKLSNIEDFPVLLIQKSAKLSPGKAAKREWLFAATINPANNMLRLFLLPRARVNGGELYKAGKDLHETHDGPDCCPDDLRSNVGTFQEYKSEPAAATLATRDIDSSWEYEYAQRARAIIME